MSLSEVTSLQIGQGLRLCLLRAGNAALEAIYNVRPCFKRFMIHFETEWYFCVKSKSMRPSRIHLTFKFLHFRHIFKIISYLFCNNSHWFHALDQSQSKKIQTSVLLQSAYTLITDLSSLGFLFGFTTCVAFKIRIFSELF